VFSRIYLLHAITPFPVWLMTHDWAPSYSLALICSGACQLTPLSNWAHFVVLRRLLGLSSKWYFHIGESLDYVLVMYWLREGKLESRCCQHFVSGRLFAPIGNVAVLSPLCLGGRLDTPSTNSGSEMTVVRLRGFVKFRSILVKFCCHRGDI
jgi:hypothetical protein